MRGKKIISLILLLSMILSLSSFQVTLAEENAADVVSVYQDEINFLKSIEILDVNFDGSAKITKAELAKMAVSLLHPDVDYSFPSEEAVFIFNDVPSTHPYYSYIKACKDIKIINGDPSGNFNPDAVVTVMDAITVMSNALGFTLYADAMGGYPSGYYQIAYKTGLLDGIKNTLANETTGDVMAKILYNALFADVSGIESVSSDGITITIDEDTNLLAKRLGIYEYDAVVYDNGISSLDGSSMGDAERVVIKDRKTNKMYSAYVNDTGISAYLGYRVKVYIRNNQEMARNEIVHFNVHKRVKTISIPADTVIYANKDYLEYEEDADDLNTKKIKFGSLRPALIFNGIKISNKGLEEVIPSDGMLTFVDNEDDGNYDVADVLSFNYDKDKNSYKEPAKNIIVDSVLTVNGQKRISCLLNPLNSLDLADENIMYAFSGISTKKSIYEVSTYDVISIAEAPELVNGKKFYFLTVGQEMVSGNLGGIVDGNKLDVNGNTYKVSSGLTSVKPRFISTLKIGSEIYLCIDITGKVAYSVSTEYGSKNYAYLVATKENKVPDNYLMVKLFTKDGEMKTYQVNSKAKIDGKTYKTVEEQKKAIEKRDSSSFKETFDKGVSRPIIFEENKDGEIIRIDTDTPNNTVENASDFYKTLTTIVYDKEEVESEETLKAGFRGLRNIDYTRTGSIENKFFITNETVILSVPDIDTYGMQHATNFYPGSTTALNVNKIDDQVINEKAVKLHELEITDSNYRIFQKSNMNSEICYDVQGYDIDENTGIAGLVILRGRTDVLYDIDYSIKVNPTYVFLRTTEVYDATREKNVKKVYYTRDGNEELSAIIDTDECYYVYKYLLEGCDKDFTPYDTEVKPLRAGDLIRVVKDGDNLVHIDRLIAVAKDIKSYYSMLYFPVNSSYLYTNSKVSVSMSDSASNRDGSAEDYGMPFDTRDYKYGTSAAIGVFFAPVKNINGNTLQMMLPFTASKILRDDPDIGEIGTIDINDPSTYNIHFINLEGLITTIDISDDGKSVKVKSGTASDIKTVTETGNIESASMVYMKMTYNKVEEVFIINNLNKIPAGEKWWVETDVK